MSELLNSAWLIEGIWWIPECPNERYFGSLSYGNGKSIKLKLMGLPSTSTISNYLKSNPTILGESFDGEAITLCDCFDCGYSWKRKKTIQTFISHRILIGHHFASKNDIHFDRLIIGFTNLGNWACITGFDFRPNF